jgi:hypothetical protein
MKARETALGVLLGVSLLGACGGSSGGGGGIWSAASQGLQGGIVTALGYDATGADLYAGMWLGGAFKSTDGGST